MRRWMIPFCWLVTAVVPCAARAEPDDDPRIRAAVRRGVEFLKHTQQADGTWDYAGHEVGMTALAALALSENGATLDDPVLKRAYEFVQAAAASDPHTYDISLAILLLSRIGQPSDKELIQQLGARLVAGQLGSGGWTYVCPQAAPPPAARITNGRTPPEPARRAGRITVGRRMGGNGFGDNSNTQFAVLGVWAAGRAGLDVQEAMAAVDQRFRTSQSTHGGWGYYAGGDTDAMTCAGLMALVLAKGEKTLDAQLVNRRPGDSAAEPPAGKPRMASDPQIEKGIKRVEDYAAGMNHASSLYFLWSVERVCVATGLSRIGRVEWYTRGADTLVQTQQADGSWNRGRGVLPDTAFALLFLKRSNLTRGMPQLMTGRGRAPDASDNRMRAGSLEDLLRTVRDAPTDSDAPDQDRKKAPPR